MELAEANRKLTREQKQAVGLLSIGTFLEYFDLMLYVHMAVLINGLFFLKTDTFSSQLISAFAFCTTFIFRPVGSLLIGWLGDNYGRKPTIVLTSFMMAGTCATMASLPSYEQIGIIASISVTLCRIFQGMSSMGERIGAELYLTEFIKTSKVYPTVAFISVCGVIGTSAALFISDIVLSQHFNWRVAFWFGAIVAVIGIVARTKLRETPDFADAKRDLHKLCDDLKIDKRKLKESLVYTQKINKKSAISYFLIQLVNPLFFYFTYIHCADILKFKFGYTIHQIVHQNFLLSLMWLLIAIGLNYLVYFIHPFKIMKIKFYFGFIYIVSCPFLLDIVSNGYELMIVQLFCLLTPTEFLGAPIFYKSFPVFKRFTTVCFSYAMARALMYVISSFGIVCLIKYFGNLGLLFLFIPVIVGYGFGLFHFIKLEGKNQVNHKESFDNNHIENRV